MHARLKFSSGRTPVSQNGVHNQSTQTLEQHSCPADDFHLAAQTNDIPRMQQLLSQNATVVNRYHSFHGTTPLCWAIENNSAEAIQFLINAGANPLLAIGPSPFYYPLYFLNDELHEDVSNSLLTYVDAHTRQYLQQLDGDKHILQCGDLISLFHNLIFLMEYEFVDYAAVDRFSRIKSVIFTHALLTDEMKYYQLSLLLAETSLLEKVMEDFQHPMDDKDLMVSDHADTLSEQLHELLNELPSDFKNNDLACELYNYAGRDINDFEESDTDYSFYYDCALLMCEADNHFEAAVLLKKSYYHVVTATSYGQDIENAIRLLNPLTVMNTELAQLAYSLANQHYIAEDNSVESYHQLIDLIQKAYLFEHHIHSKSVIKMMSHLLKIELLILQENFLEADYLLTALIDEEQRMNNLDGCHYYSNNLDFYPLDFFNKIVGRLSDTCFSTSNRNQLSLRFSAIGSPLSIFKKIIPLIAILNNYSALYGEGENLYHSIDQLLLKGHHHFFPFNNSHDVLSDLYAFLKDIQPWTNSPFIDLQLMLMDLNFNIVDPVRAIEGCLSVMEGALLHNIHDAYVSALSIICHALNFSQRLPEAYFIAELMTHADVAENLDVTKLLVIVSCYEKVKLESSNQWIANIYFDFLMRMIAKKMEHALQLDLPAQLGAIETINVIEEKLAKILRRSNTVSGSVSQWGFFAIEEDMEEDAPQLQPLHMSYN